MTATPLYPFQINAVSKIFQADAPVFNAFDPGLGKTRVAIEILKAKGYRRILVVCPASALLVWGSEIRRWWPGHPPVTVLTSGSQPLPIRGEGVLVMSYGRLSQNGADKFLIGSDTFQATILDEAHYLKNPRANRTKNLWKVRRTDKLGWVHPMSGTPAPNHAGELWSLLYQLRPDLIRSPLHNKPMPEHEFIERYCEVDRFKINGHQVERIKGSKNREELRGRIAPMFLRARKQDVLPDLPPLDFVTLPVPAVLPPDVKAQLDHGFGIKSDDALLSELAAHAGMSELRALGLAKVEPVSAWVSDLLDNDPKRRLCLWAIHHDVIDEYARLLNEYGVAQFDGRTSLTERKLAVENFMRGKDRIFLGQVIAGGTALTLVSEKAPCTDVIFGEASYSPANNFQAACRVHRIGQKDGVLARYAAAAGTLDDRVQAILARKSRDLVELFG